MKSNVPSNTFYSVYSFDTKEESCQSEDGLPTTPFLKGAEYGVKKKCLILEDETSERTLNYMSDSCFAIGYTMFFKYQNESSINTLNFCCSYEPK